MICSNKLQKNVIVYLSVYADSFGFICPGLELTQISVYEMSDQKTKYKYI